MAKQLAIVITVYDRDTQEYIRKIYNMPVLTPEQVKAINPIIAGVSPEIAGHGSLSPESEEQLILLETPIKDTSRFWISTTFGIFDTETNELELGWSNF